MTDRCISLLIRSSPWSSDRPTSFPSPLSPLLYLLFFRFDFVLERSPRSLFFLSFSTDSVGSVRYSAFVCREEGVRPPRVGTEGTPRGGEAATTDDDLIKNESVGGPRRPITRPGPATKIDATERFAIAFLPCSHRSPLESGFRRFLRAHGLPGYRVTASSSAAGAVTRRSLLLSLKSIAVSSLHRASGNAP